MITTALLHTATMSFGFSHTVRPAMLCSTSELENMREELLEAKELWNFLLPLNLFLLKVERRLGPS